MTLYKCNGCAHTCVASWRPKACEACGSPAMWLESEAEVALPGCEQVARERAEANGVAVAAQLSARMRTPKDNISREAGRIERDSPLFRGQGENQLLF